MSKFILYIALTVVLVSSLGPNMQGMQVIRIPNLLSHVEKHFGQDWEWSEMYSFFKEHYLNDRLPADNEHKNLPFKTVSVSITAMFVETRIPLVFQDQEWSDEVHSKPIVQPSRPTIDRSSNIWTPPQLS